MRIAYIGKKPVKTDTISGSRMVFRPFEVVEVEKEFALRLLQFPNVYVEEKYLEDTQKSLEQKEREDAAARQEAEEAKQAAIRAASREIEVDGVMTDIGKSRTAQLKTLIESQDLDIPTEVDGESLDDLRNRVFFALKEKQEAEEQA